MNETHLPPGQQLAAPGKWPLVGEREPAPFAGTWSLTISGCVERPRTWSIDELRSMTQVERAVDIHCVTRWSKLGARFGGVLLSDLLDQVRPTPNAQFASFVAHSPRQHSTSLPLADALSLDTLLALSYEGKPLSVDHGGPLRSVVPGRYFYKSVKWLIEIELLEQDRLGFWEATAGYHNRADPWLEERFIASSLTKADAARLLADLDVSNRELLGLDGSDRDLRGLNARGALLRNCNFSRAKLTGACFERANLSNAKFIDAKLNDASFVRADLEGSDFSGADLRGADLTGASLFGVTFFTRRESQPDHAAQLDTNTRFDPASLEALTPEQAEFVQRCGASNS